MLNVILVFSEHGPCWLHFLGSEFFSPWLAAESVINPNSPEILGSSKASV